MDGDKVGLAIAAVFGTIITLAIVSVIVGQKSQAPEAISAAGSFISGIVAAAVNPVHTAPTNGNLGLNSFSTPAIVGGGFKNLPSFLGGAQQPIGGGW